MALTKEVTRRKYSVSFNRQNFMDNVIIPRDLSKRDLRIILLLLCRLDGYVPPKTVRSNTKDPANFSDISIKRIAKTLGYKKSEVKKSLKKLVELEILEYGVNEANEHGYRFVI